MTVIDEIAAERRRQIEVEGWTPERDDGHTDGMLATAGAIYARYASDDGLHAFAVEMREAGEDPDDWLWAEGWFKPKSRRRDLIRAAALLVAEVERLDRADKLKAEEDAA
jgi:hypothetical protein